VPVNPVVTPVTSAHQFTGSINFYKVMLDNINGTTFTGKWRGRRMARNFPRC